MPKRRRKHPVKVSFILKSKADKESLILLSIRINKRRVTWSTGEKVAVKDWSLETKRPIVRARNVELAKIKERLNKYESEAIALHNDWNLTDPEKARKTNPEDFKQELNYRTEKEERPNHIGNLDESDFGLFAKDFVALRANQINLAKATLKSERSKLRTLQAFIKTRYGGTLPFYAVDENFVESFKAYLLRDREMGAQTANKHLTNLRAIIRKADERNLLRFSEAIKKAAKVPFRQLPKVYLTWEEIIHFRQLDLSDRPRLEKVRDLFLIGVLTAQRWSDYSTLSPDNFIPMAGGGYRYEIFTQQKTKSKAGGPVMDWGLPILRKYGYIGDEEFNPPTISGQKFNEYLKEVAELVFGDELFRVYRDGETVDQDGTKMKKAALMSSHAARRTAVSLLRDKKLTDRAIQGMTGHKNPDQVNAYDVRDAENRAEAIKRQLEKAFVVPPSPLRKVD